MMRLYIWQIWPKRTRTYGRSLLPFLRTVCVIVRVRSFDQRAFNVGHAEQRRSFANVSSMRERIERHACTVEKG